MEVMGTKKLNQKRNKRERVDDPDYNPSHPLAKKTKAEKKNSIQLKASDKTETSRSKGYTVAKPEDLYDNALSQFSVVVKTERTLASLPNDIPCFVKRMLPSTVKSGFWMYFTKDFCDLHLPKHDARVVLVDDSGEEYITKFILSRRGLSAGWVDFSRLHGLKSGEMVVFQLIEPCKFKVHIVRIPDPDAIEAAKTIMHMSGSCLEPYAVLKEKFEMRKKRLYAIAQFNITTQLGDSRKCLKPKCWFCRR